MAIWVLRWRQLSFRFSSFEGFQRKQFQTKSINGSIHLRKNITDIGTNISALSGVVEGGNSSNLTANALIEAPKFDSTSVDKNVEASPNPAETISEAVSVVDSSAKSENSEAVPALSKDGLVQSLEQLILQPQLNQGTQGDLNSQNKRSVSATRTSTRSHDTQTRRTAAQRRSLQTSRDRHLRPGDKDCSSRYPPVERELE